MIVTARHNHMLKCETKAVWKSTAKGYNNTNGDTKKTYNNVSAL